MKHVLFIVLVLLSCREKVNYPDGQYLIVANGEPHPIEPAASHYHYTSIVIVGNDTISYIDGTTNYTKVKHYSAHGYNDTVSRTFFDTIWIKPQYRKPKIKDYIIWGESESGTDMLILDTTGKGTTVDTLPSIYPSFHFGKDSGIKSTIQFFTIDTTDYRGETQIIFNFTDSTIQIYGDTTKALWLMYKCYDDLLKKYNKCEDQKITRVKTTLNKWTDATQAHRDTMVIYKKPRQ